MSNAVLSHFDEPKSPAVPGVGWLAVPALWLALVFLLGAGEVLVLLGILDLIVAVSLGALATILSTDVIGAVTTAPMSHIPLVIIPAFLVPGFIILHLAALFQARNLARHLKG